MLLNLLNLHQFSKCNSPEMYINRRKYSENEVLYLSYCPSLVFFIVSAISVSHHYNFESSPPLVTFSHTFQIIMAGLQLRSKIALILLLLVFTGQSFPQFILSYPTSYEQSFISTRGTSEIFSTCYYSENIFRSTNIVIDKC